MSRPRERIPVSGPQGGFSGAFDSLPLELGEKLRESVGPSSGVTTSQPGLDQAAVAPTPTNRSFRGSGRLILSRSKAHRAGKVVICIAGFPSGFSDADIEGLARKLRSRCGCGGTVSGRVVEVQGDQAERVRAFLESEGFQVAGIK